MNAHDLVLFNNKYYPDRPATQENIKADDRNIDLLFWLEDQVGLYCPDCDIKLHGHEIYLGLCDWCDSERSTAKDRHPAGKEALAAYIYYNTEHSPNFS